MSLAFDILSKTHGAVAVPIHGDTLALQDDVGTAITGILNDQPDIIPEFEVGVDPREVAQFTVQRPIPKGTFNRITRSIDSNDKLKFGIHTFMVIKRKDNAAELGDCVDFWLVKNVYGRDISPSP